jgi:phosphatidylglycerol:prolipoprotein diacylglycerol transferase
MFEFPDISPVALDFGIIKIRWYALSYIAGILMSWYLILKIIKLKRIDINTKQVSDLVGNSMIGIIIGGRLGYVLFYNPEYYFNNLIEIFKIWNGGMSFHGGFLGVVFAIIYSSKLFKVPLLTFSDLIALVTPVGLFFGRLANFVNGELYGRITNHPFGMVFPTGGDLPRHPSQLYEALFEGIILFIILWIMASIFNLLKRPGLITSYFIFLYGLFRFFIEFYREPDEHMGLLYFELSMGQILSIPMILTGLYFSIIFFKKNENFKD